MKHHQDKAQQGRIDALNTAAGEAERFVKSARAAAQDLNTKEWTGEPSKPYAAAKRASLDLTAALVKVRYPEGRS